MLMQLKDQLDTALVFDPALPGNLDLTVLQRGSWRLTWEFCRALAGPGMVSRLNYKRLSARTRRAAA